MPNARLDWTDFRAAAAMSDTQLWDIHVASTDEADWERLLAALPGSGWFFGFTLNGRPAPLPARFDAAINRDNNDVLRVDPDGLRMQLHFHAVDAIAFNVSLDDLADEASFERLRAFMTWLADLLDKPAVLGELVVPSARATRDWVGWVHPGRRG